MCFTFAPGGFVYCSAVTELINVETLTSGFPRLIALYRGCSQQWHKFHLLLRRTLVRPEH